jgi:hypothetical protein
MNAAARAVDYDEKFRFKAFSPTIASASGGGFQNSMAGATNITVNIAGSVTAEDDLVQAIRQGLLYGQGNGDTLTLQAI